MNKILIIDDNVDNLVSISALIKNFLKNCDPITAQNGKDGIKMAQVKKPDTILLDIQMPGIDGYETCKMLKQDSSTKHIPVIMLTAVRTSSQDRIKGLNTGADAFIAKPIDEGELIAQVNVMLRIKEAEDKLRAEKNALEKMVQERTKELNIQNKELIIAIEKVEENEEKFKAITSQSVEGITVANMDGKYIYVNPAFCKMSGYTTDELLRLTVFDMKAKNQSYSSFYESKKEKEGKPIIVNLMRKDKKEYLTEIVGKIIKMNNQQFVLRTVRDISKQKKAEKAFSKSQYHLSVAQEMGMIGTWELDIKKNILIWTEEKYRIFGMSPRIEMNYELFLDCIHPDDRDYVHEKWSAALKKEPYDIECRIIANDKVKWLNEKANIKFDEEGKPLMAIGFTQDITKRKLAEIALNESDQKFREAETISHVGYYEMDFINEHISWSDETFRIFGLNPGGKEPSIEEYKKLIHKEDIAKVFNLFEECIIKAKTFDLIYRIVTLKGKIKYVHSIGKIKKDVNGKVIKMFGTFHDITERKRAEEKLKANEQKLSTITNAANDAIILIDNNGNISFWNPAAEKIFGFKKEEIQGKNIHKILAPEKYKETINHAFAKFQKSGRGNAINKIIEVDALKKNGESIAVELSLSSIKIDGKWCAVGIVKDISLRKQAEEALKESEEKYKNLFNNAEVAIYRTKQDGSGFLDVNEKFLSIIGYTREELIGRPSVLNWADPEERKEMIRILKKDGHVQDYEVKLLNKNNEVLNCITSLKLYHDSGILEGTFLDITKRKEAELKLIESETKFKMLFNSANDAVFLVDMNNKFIEVNDEAVKRYGYSKKEFLTMGVHHLSPAELNVKTKKEIEAVQKTKSRVFRHKHKKADGTIIPVEISTRKINYNDETAFLVLVHDISEVEKNQQKILNASILAEEKERSRVAKELHDGVSPLLSTINLFVQTLKKPKEQKLQTDLYDRIESILHETIKSISEISSNLSPHVLFNFGLNVAIKKFIENLSGITKINIKFKCDLDVQLNDKHKLSIYRVTTELLNNTIKYANATEVNISITGKNNLEFTYSDNGKGFDVKKVISSKKRMGLFNIINRIESLNGTVVINSEKGKGINVQLSLPIE